MAYHRPNLSCLRAPEGNEQHHQSERLRLQKEALWSQARSTQPIIPLGWPTRRTQASLSLESLSIAPRRRGDFGRVPHPHPCAPIPTAHLPEPSISVPPLPSVPTVVLKLACAPASRGGLVKILVAWVSPARTCDAVDLGQLSGLVYCLESPGEHFEDYWSLYTTQTNQVRFHPLFISFLLFFFF